MKRGDIIEGTIEKISFPCKGSFIYNGEEVTVKNVLPGAKVKCRIKKRKTGLTEAMLLETLEESPLAKLRPMCPHFYECGGCMYQDVEYDEQLRLKEDIVKRLIDNAVREGGYDYEWEGIFSSPEQFNYRNKMEYTFGDAYKDGPLTVGLHRQGSNYDIITTNGCTLVKPAWNKILEYTEKFFREKDVSFYRTMQHTGILRNLVIRESHVDGRILMNLVTTTKRDISSESGLPKKGTMTEYMNRRNEIYDELCLDEYVAGLVKMSDNDELSTLQFHNSISGILYTENDSFSDTVQSDHTQVLYGNDYLVEEILGLRFRISPFSFFQTNSKGCEVLYSKAREYAFTALAEENGGRTGVIYDLYSGTGTIAQLMSAVAEKVIGIEIVEEAVRAAKENAKLNGIKNCEFIAGDVFKKLDEVEEKPDLIILDPPRDGINPKALDKIISYGVKNIIYISCKPTSLARDIRIFQKNGYRVVKGCAIDEFPNTVHVETVCLLSQRKPDTTIEVDLDISELEVSSAETKATYEEIKSYVLKKYGLKVSNLYIAQVKRECGIVERINYNLPKTEGNRVPQCPEDKRKAIKDAFIHFQMI